MAMGIVSSKDFEIESHNLTKPTSQNKITPRVPISPVEEVPAPRVEILDKAGRKEDDVETPNSIRKLIADEKLQNGRASAIKLAEQFGLSPSSVSAYSVGATSTTSIDKPKKENVEHINIIKEKIIKKATGKLNMALNNITEDKLAHARVTAVASVARDMAAIVKQMEPDSTNDNEVIRPQLVFYAPTLISEDKYETVIVRE